MSERIPVEWMHDATKAPGGTPVPVQAIGFKLTALLIASSSVMMFFDRLVLDVVMSKKEGSAEQTAAGYQRLEFRINVGEWQGEEIPTTPDHPLSRETFDHIGGETLDSVTAFAEGVVFNFGSFVFIVSGWGIKLAQVTIRLNPEETPPGRPC